MLDDKQGVAGSVNNTIGLNINQDTEPKNWGHWTCLGPGSYRVVMGLNLSALIISQTW